MKTWKETPGCEEERMIGTLKERVKKYRMKMDLESGKEEEENDKKSVAPSDVEMRNIVVERKKLFEDVEEDDKGEPPRRKPKIVLLKEDSWKNSLNVGRSSILDDLTSEKMTTETKKVQKTTMEKTSSNNCGQAEPTLLKLSPHFTEGLQPWQVHVKKAKIDIEAAKVSGKLCKTKFTKPQLVYCGVGTNDQTDRAVPARSTNGRGGCGTSSAVRDWPANGRGVCENSVGADGVWPIRRRSESRGITARPNLPGENL